MGKHILSSLLLIVLLTSTLSACSGGTVTETVTSTETQTETTTTKVSTPYTKSFENLQGSDSMSFTAHIGDVIEGNVNVVHEGLQWGYSYVICGIKDPFGNLLIQTKTKATDNGTQSIQNYPWGFSFFASTDGEYLIEVTTDCMVWNKDLAIIAELQDTTPKPIPIIVNIALVVTHNGD